jgi:membrane protein implicated in regulation of membrane protease activity
MGDVLIPLMPLFGTAPLAIAAVVIFSRWQRRREHPLNELQAQNAQLQEQLEGLRQQLEEAHERLDYAERVLAQQPRARAVPGVEPGSRQG